jgi:Tfp pilus assembly protein PilF
MEAQARYAAALSRFGQPAQAEEVLTRALQRRPDDPALLLQLGRLRLRTGAAQEAVGLFDRVLARRANHVEALTGSGVALDLLGRPAEAQQSYRAALAAAPDNIAAANNLAMSLMMEGRAQEAVAILAPLTRRAGAPPRVLNNLGIAQAAAGDRSTAQATLGGRISADDLDGIALGLGAPPPARPPEPPQARLRAREPVADRTEPSFGAIAPAAPAPVASAPVVAIPTETPPAPAAASSVPAAVPPAPAATAPASASSAPRPAAPDATAPAVGIATSGSDPAIPPVGAPAQGGRSFVVQLGALPSEGAAQGAWQRLARDMPDLFEAREPRIERVERNDAAIWRLRTDGFAGSGDAREFCTRLRSAGHSCFVAGG